MSLTQGRISVKDAIARIITPELERLLEEQRQPIPGQPIILNRNISYACTYDF